ncbi:MAG: nucleotidyltransferase family protein [Limnochordales bacterium]|nr:nucleotidyltransferase family protein [Limnochordales bacterium]
MEPQIAHNRETNRPAEVHLEWFPWCLPCEAQSGLPAHDVGESAHKLLAWAARQRTSTIVSYNLLHASFPLRPDVRAVCWACTAKAQKVWVAYIRQVGAVADILSRAGCHWVLLKGAGFAATAYPEPWLRTCGDIDVLVAADELELVHEALVQQGFRQDQEYDIRALARKVRAGRARLQHFPPYFRPTGDSILPRITVEVHHRLTAAGEPYGLPADEILSRAILLQTPEASLWIPSPEMNLLVAVTHAYRHARSLNEIVQGEDFRLGRFVDVVQLLRHYGHCLNGEEVLRVAQRNGLETALAFVRKVVDECFGPQPWPAGFDHLRDQASVAQKIADATLFDHEVEVGQWSLPPAQRFFQADTERCLEALLALYSYLRAKRKQAIAAEDQRWDSWGQEFLGPFDPASRFFGMGG